jgi:hypothetical protein
MIYAEVLNTFSNIHNLSFIFYRRFKKKLSELVKMFKVKEIPLTNMMAFVIMAENFDKHSSYIKRVVSDALEDISSYGRQETLLIYLAIMRYFGDNGLPSSQCHSFIDDLGSANIKNTSTLLDNLSSQAKLFVVEISTEKAHNILEITHTPVAYQLLDKFTQFGTGFKKAKLKKYVQDLLYESKIMEKRFLKDDVHEAIRDLLGKNILSNNLPI